MSFFSNKTINNLNLHNSFVTLLSQICSVFACIYLYQQGFSLFQVFSVLGTLSIGRIIMRFFTLPMLKYCGLKTVIIISTIGYGVAVLTLSQVNGINGWFFAYIILYSLFNSMYWLSLHIFYTLQGQEEHRGKQYSVRNILTLSGQAVFPLLSAFAIKYLGYDWYFCIAIPIVICALIPVLFCANKLLVPENWQMSRKQLFSVGVRTSIFQGTFDEINNNAWIFIVFLFFDGKIVSFASMLTIGVVVQIICQIFIGNRIDKGKIFQIATIGCCLSFMTVMGQALAPLSVMIIPVIEIFNSISKLHLSSLKDVAAYNDSHRKNGVVWYWLCTETARDIGPAIGFFTIAFLTYSGMPLRNIMLFSLPILPIIWYVLTRYSKG